MFGGSCTTQTLYLISVSLVLAFLFLLCLLLGFMMFFGFCFFLLASCLALFWIIILDLFLLRFGRFRCFWYFLLLFFFDLGCVSVLFALFCFVVGLFLVLFLFFFWGGGCSIFILWVLFFLVLVCFVRLCWRVLASSLVCFCAVLCVDVLCVCWSGLGVVSLFFLGLVVSLFVFRLSLCFFLSVYSDAHCCRCSSIFWGFMNNSISVSYFCFWFLPFCFCSVCLLVSWCSLVFVSFCWLLILLCFKS